MTSENTSAEAMYPAGQSASHGQGSAREPVSSGFPNWKTLIERYLAEKREDSDIRDTAIQTFWFADYLARRRREKLGVKASEDYNAKKGLSDTFVASSNDGRCTSTTIYTHGEKSTVYKLGNRKLKVSSRRPVNFSILAADNPKDTRICPNCAAESKREDCIDGCPHCGTKFLLTDYTYQVSGESYGVMNYHPQRLLLSLSGVIAIICFAEQYFTKSADSILLLLINSLAAGVFLGLAAYLALQLPMGIYIFVTRIVRDSRFGDFCKKLRRTDPLLSTDELAADFESRIRGFFLSDESDNIRFISGVKPGQYTDVADVRIAQYKSLNMVPTQGLSVIRTHVILELIRVRNGRLLREKKPFAIDFYRSSAVKTDLHTEKEVFTCPSCAGTLSILDGGHCNFCGSTTDLSAYGWVLGAVVAE